MRLGRIDAGPDRLAGTWHETALGAGTQHLAADAEIDDVMRAEWLNDMRLDGHVALALFARDQHAFGADTERQVAVLAAGGRELVAECGGEVEALRYTADADADLA